MCDSQLDFRWEKSYNQCFGDNWRNLNMYNSGVCVILLIDVNFPRRDSDTRNALGDECCRYPGDVR